MSRFVIAPHMRLHEWVAVEKGYFDEEGLDYELHDELYGADGRRHHLGDKVGAYQTFEKGRKSDVSCACHWTVNVAAASGHGKLYADCYSVSPCGIFVSADSDIRTPEDLAGVPVSVGYQSGSHYSTIQALEQFLKPEEINLSFADGLLFSRLEMLIDGEVPAASLFSGPYYFLEQLGFRKVVDTSFMMASMVAETADREDIEKYFRALKRAQADIDLRPELYTHYYRNEFPERFREQMDTRLFGPGERIVFEPYSREIFESSRQWIAERNIFEDGDLGARDYADAVVVSAAE
jgi:ABC-type nitrate/sulfonate/bicarbonate transport system substrate-binding protein